MSNLSAYFTHYVVHSRLDRFTDLIFLWLDVGDYQIR